MLNRRFAVCFFVMLSLSVASAQHNCPLAPSLEPTSASENIFTDEQEVDLGDAIAETITLHFNVIEDAQLTAHLRDIGDRLVHHLPPTKLNFRFYLVDLPEVNAFSIAGGRVYISRKLVAFVRNDDELAGVVAHELGHIVTHQTAIAMTRALREVLGITQVSTREDIFQKYHRLLENAARARRHRDGSENKQIVADQVSVYTLARAGFAPNSMPDFWDRFAELHGKKGSWLSDLFGTSTPEQHRLRDMVKNMAALPPGCTDAAVSGGNEIFSAWRDAVVDYDGHPAEYLPDLISKRRLTTRLRPEVANLRFSPDGKYILAQDDGGIHIVSRDPFASLFYIPAPDARDAQFSPDSRSVVFLASSLRVEKWSVVERKRVSVHEVTLHGFCLQSELAPDGSTLACLNEQFSLQLIDVAKGGVIFQREHFYTPSIWEILSLVLRATAAKNASDADSDQTLMRLVNIRFSPDARYLLASYGVRHLEFASTTSVLLFDLDGRREVKVPTSIKDVLGVNFAFVGADKIVGVNPGAVQKSRVLKFPSGERVAEVPLSFNVDFRGATSGDFLLVGPMRDYPLGIMDLSSGKIIAAIHQKTADMWAGVFITERMNGELALHARGITAPTAILPLPESSLGKVKVASVSSDLKYLAIATRTRGAIWDLSRDARVFHVRRFDGAGFYGQAAYAEFPKYEETSRSIAEMNIDSGSVNQVRELKDDIVAQHGKYLITTRIGKKASPADSEADIAVEDVRTGQPLWGRHFRSMPDIRVSVTNGTIVMSWPISSSGGQDELKRLKDLASNDREDVLCEVADASMGALAAHFVFKTNRGSLHVLRAEANHDWAVLEANRNQVLSYVLPAGSEQGHFFGNNAVLSPAGLLALDSGKQEIAIYDLTTSQQQQHYTFGAPIALKVFSSDAKRLLVLTSDQTVYVLDVTHSTADTEAVSADIH